MFFLQTPGGVDATFTGLQEALQTNDRQRAYWLLRELGAKQATLSIKQKSELNKLTRQYAGATLPQRTYSQYRAFTRMSADTNLFSLGLICLLAVGGFWPLGLGSSLFELGMALIIMGVVKCFASNVPVLEGVAYAGLGVWRAYRDPVSAVSEIVLYGTLLMAERLWDKELPQSVKLLLMTALNIYFRHTFAGAQSNARASQVSSEYESVPELEPGTIVVIPDRCHSSVEEQGRIFEVVQDVCAYIRNSGQVEECVALLENHCGVMPDGSWARYVGDGEFASSFKGRSGGFFVQFNSPTQCVGTEVIPSQFKGTVSLQSFESLAREYLGFAKAMEAYCRDVFSTAGSKETKPCRFVKKLPVFKEGFTLDSAKNINFTTLQMLVTQLETGIMTQLRRVVNALKRPDANGLHIVKSNIMFEKLQAYNAQFQQLISTLYHKGTLDDGDMRMIKLLERHLPSIISKTASAVLVMGCRHLMDDRQLSAFLTQLQQDRRMPVLMLPGDATEISQLTPFAACSSCD